uniref:Ubiquitin-like domain-containing protein n=1 Tax=Kalanchoe fedtschenkoi TaxID=63787 RepID=A0A7N0UCG6_KALFE
MHHSSPETPPAMIKLEDASPSPSEKVQIRLRMPSPISPISIEMSQSDTFSKLKDKIHDLEHIPPHRVSLYHSHKELHDQIPVRDFDGQEVGVSVKQSPTASFGSGASHGASSRNKLRLMVLPKNGTQRIPVEVNAGDCVGELRRELGRLQERMGFSLPAEGYFFIYKQNVMDDDQSFRWHDVGQGDTIEIFNGSVTGGS